MRHRAARVSGRRYSSWDWFVGGPCPPRLACATAPPAAFAGSLRELTRRRGHHIKPDMPCLVPPIHGPERQRVAEGGGGAVAPASRGGKAGKAPCNPTPRRHRR